MFITAYESGLFAGENYYKVRERFFEGNWEDGRVVKQQSINDVVLPKSSLHSEGVKFYYSPYSLGRSFVEGDIEFLIPYEKIIQYMTEQGKWLIADE